MSELVRRNSLPTHTNTIPIKVASIMNAQKIINDKFNTV